MKEHLFIFTPGLWLGEGVVTFNASHESIKFHTRWTCSDTVDGAISLRHEVELQGVPEKVTNELVVSDVTEESFKIALTNDMVENVPGTGIIEEGKLAWEFRGEPGFEGFEVYDLGSDGVYKVHAEYLSSDQFRTIIDGRIWKKGGDS